MMTTNWRIRQAVKTLNNGGVIAYPTEAVYGLGCDPWNEDAVIRLLTIKQRPWNKGLIIIAADFNQLQPFIEPVSPSLLSQLESSWPGPTTWLLPVRSDVPDILYGEHDTIAIRVTAHKQTAELCRAANSALVSTSANITGMRPAKTVHQVRWQMPDVDYVLPGQCSGSLNPTEIRNARTGEKIR
ncbi:MAG: threonylcarbamoyl-AMP synthase [Gammaproteobacteria bacterium]|nr:MAG: threonylcarbamoyl-AMP synthase [Gammaproteobacteria bacterium]